MYSPFWPVINIISPQVENIQNFLDALGDSVEQRMNGKHASRDSVGSWNETVNEHMHDLKKVGSLTLLQSVKHQDCLLYTARGKFHIN